MQAKIFQKLFNCQTQASISLNGLFLEMNYFNGTQIQCRLGICFSVEKSVHKNYNKLEYGSLQA